jgi:hypothetical protein
LQGNRLEAVELGNGGRFAASQFIDATVNAQLARAAGAAWRPGGLASPASGCPMRSWR